MMSPCRVAWAARGAAAEALPNSVRGGSVLPAHRDESPGVPVRSQGPRTGSWPGAIRRVDYNGARTKTPRRSELHLMGPGATAGAGPAVPGKVRAESNVRLNHFLQAEVGVVATGGTGSSSPPEEGMVSLGAGPPITRGGLRAGRPGRWGGPARSPGALPGGCHPRPHTVSGNRLGGHGETVPHSGEWHGILYYPDHRVEDDAPP